MEVAKSWASYTTQLGFWNIRDILKAKLGGVQKAVEVVVLHLLTIQRVM